jgi:diaminopimelate epimerase
LAKKICDRHKGVGADGIFIVDAISPDSAFVEMFNSDGSTMEFCGNGVRGVSLYLREQSKSRSRSFAVLTGFGEYDVRITKTAKHKQLSLLRIGNPSFDGRVIGFSKRLKNSLGVELKSNSRTWTLHCIAMPNPHAVVIVENFDFDWKKEGSIIEQSALFKNRTNVMFTKADSKRKLTVKAWERGAGATLSCGSGAAAATVISGLLGYTKGVVSVNMPGGVLKTRWDIGENTVYQEGASGIVCTGSFRY